MDTCPVYTCPHTDMQAHTPHLQCFYFIYPHQLFLLSVELCILMFVYEVWGSGGLSVRAHSGQRSEKRETVWLWQEAGDEVTAKQMQIEACHGPESC